MVDEMREIEFDPFLRHTNPLAASRMEIFVTTWEEISIGSAVVVYLFDT